MERSLRIKTRGRQLCDMVNKNYPVKPADNFCEKPDISLNQMQFNSFYESSLRNITDSPLPISFNESEMNEIANILDADIFTSTMDTVDIATDTSNHSNPETIHPSPACSINHLGYDCDNSFCPYYMEKENLPIHIIYFISAITSI